MSSSILFKSLIRSTRRLSNSQRPLLLNSLSSISNSQRSAFSFSFSISCSEPRNTSFTTTKPFCSTPSPSPASSKVLQLKTDDEFSAALTKAQENRGVAVVYYTATWCPPCRAIAPVIETMGKSYSNVTFLKLDIDEESLSSTLKASGVSSVPTFHFYKSGAQVAHLVGASPERLKEIIENISD